MILFNSTKIVYNCHDFIDIKKIKQNKDVLFSCCFFQRTEYFLKYKVEIKKKLFYKKEDNFNGLTIHLRSGDCWGTHEIPGNGTNYPWQPIPPISFYKNIIKDENNIRFIVESKTDPILLKLQKIYNNRNIIVQSKDFLTDLYLHKHSK